MNTTRSRRQGAASLLLALAISVASTAQEVPEQTAPTPPPRVTRQALAHIVQSIDAKFAAGRRLPASEERSALAATNLAFDRATGLFFQLNLVDARAELEALDRGLGVLESADASKPEETTEKIGGGMLRQSLLRTLDGLGDAPEHAVRAVRSRLELKWEDPSPERSAEFLIDVPAFEAALKRDVAALEKGLDPFLDRRGDHWRTFVHGRRDLVARVYCPESAPAKGIPLVVALHGAGGDESFMFELGGDGRIKELADRHGCLVVAPFTTDFLFSAKPFASLLAGIERSYDIDRSRVYVLGHSMGAMATAGLAEKARDSITAACCIAGYRATQSGDLPMLVLAGTLDRIVSFGGVKAAAEKAARAGRPVRFESLEDQGHTLLLAAALDLAFAAWFEGIR
ncbi:Alpha/beta hydrolase family protein [Planctomycetes bacterium Poly30]|uniref:Alpha/beta hydrolase family protein n=1 Tax=Saltatorellus ferox TaxID=2528018 RepID=A0A518EYF7_9BACT|nr:Alpha/beta hydrolase family protein [Planctomycetes bacterium Poly30]